MIDVLRIAHLRIAPQEGNLEVGNCEGNLKYSIRWRRWKALTKSGQRGIDGGGECYYHHHYLLLQLTVASLQSDQD